MSTSCYHTNYSNQKNNKNTGLPHSLRSFVMTGVEDFLYSTYFLKTKHYLKNPHPPQVAATSPFSNKGEVKKGRSLAASVATAPIGMDYTFGASTSFSSIVGDIMISTTQNVLSQAIQGQVDIGNVVLTAFTTAAGAQIPHHFQFPRIEMQNAFIAVTSTAFADMIENHGRINPENIAIAMAGVAAAYGANEINKKLAEYFSPEEKTMEKQKPEKPVAKRLNPKAPLSQKELQDVKNAQDKLQRPSAKSPPVRSRWQPASGNEMENDVGDIFSAMVNESFKNSDEPRGAETSRRTNDARIEKGSDQPISSKNTPQQKPPQKNAFWKTVDTLNEMQSGTSKGLMNSLVFSQFDQSHMTTAERAGYYIGEVFGFSAGLMTGATELRVAATIGAGVKGAASLISKGLERFGTFARGAEPGLVGMRGSLAINASTPAEIAWGYGELSARQEKILSQLVKPGDALKLPKSAISVTDLASLTAKTGDEFGLFTLGSQRILVRGGAKGLEIDGKLERDLLSNGYRWSAHTHPGLESRVLMPSGIPGDRGALQLFNQTQSLILNSRGERAVFNSGTEFYVSNRMKNSILNRP